MSEQSEKVVMKQALKQLDKVVTDTILYFEKLDRADLPTLCKSYKLLADNFEALETLYKMLGTLKQNLSYNVIPDSIESAGFENVTVGGYLYSIGVRTHASLADTSKGFEWLRDNGYDALIKEHVNSQSLSGAIKSYVEEKGLNPPEEAIKIHRQKYTSVRKK